jgi:hypothetical protein
MRWESIENPPFLVYLPAPPQWPATPAWLHLKQRLPLGTILTGTVFTQAIFGVFFDAGVGFPVRMNITDFGIETEQGMQFPADYPALNSKITGVLGGFDERNRQLVVRKWAAQSLHK